MTTFASRDLLFPSVQRAVCRYAGIRQRSVPSVARMTTGAATETMQKALPFGEYVTLSDGNRMPQLGFGVYEVSGEACERAVTTALEAGYRSIDSAEWYGNEAACGAAIRRFLEASRGAVARSDVFFTSKLMSLSTYAHARRAIRASVEASGLGYLDLYLLHSPYPSAEARRESWRACEDAVAEGLVRSVGVSNFGRRHLAELLASRPRLRPTVNQVDVHPFMTREREVAYCAAEGVQVEAWGPLARGERLDHAGLVALAAARSRTPAQVMLRWSLQRGYVCIPKSVSPARIRENCDVFDFALSAEEMARLDGLDEYLVTDWDPIGDKRV